jgi:membrane-associated protein
MGYMGILDPEKIIQTGGLFLVGAIVFAESGLAVGFFLPGDTLLFATGFFVAQGKLPALWIVIGVITAAAIAGDNVGYTIGRRFGPRLFKKKDGLIFKQDQLVRAEAFYEKHGGKTIVLARFVPVVRTFAPMVAGASKMTRKSFLTYNVIGALLWGGGVTTLGYFLGNVVPNIDAYLMPVVVLAMLFTFAPTIIHLLRDPEIRAVMIAKVKSLFLKTR